MKNAFKILMGSIILVVMIVSCKKENNKPEPVSPAGITGNWLEKVPGDVNRRISFGVGMDFSMVTIIDASHSTSLHGKYSVNGNAVNIIITESVSRSGDQSVTTAVNQSVYDKASFNVKDDKLTLKFIGFPASGTTESQAVFNRLIMID